MCEQKWQQKTEVPELLVVWRIFSTCYSRIMGRVQSLSIANKITQWKRYIINTSDWIWSEGLEGWITYWNDMGRKYHIYFYDSCVWCHLILVLVIRCCTTVQRGNKPIYLNRIQGNLGFPKNRWETPTNRPLKTHERPLKRRNCENGNERKIHIYLLTKERPATDNRRAIMFVFRTGARDTYLRIAHESTYDCTWFL